MRIILIGTVLLALAVLATPAQALPVELALVIDGSGSIGSTDFNSQRTAYVNALNAVIPGFYGSVAIGVWQFSSTVQLEIAPFVIDDATDLATLTNAIATMQKLGGGTAIGAGITTAADGLLGNAIDSDRQVIDVSTDGFNNVGTEPGPAAEAAVAAGIEQVNALGIGVVPDFNRGVGSFALNVSGFGQEFENALRSKLTREITGQIPEPATVALLGLGLAGILVVRRRRK